MGKEKRIIDFNIEINKKKKSSTISKEALQNPYNKQMTFSSDFVSEHYLEGMISDQHFYQRFSFFFNFKIFFKHIFFKEIVWEGCLLLLRDKCKINPFLNLKVFSFEFYSRFSFFHVIIGVASDEGVSILTVGSFGEVFCQSTKNKIGNNFYFFSVSSPPELCRPNEPLSFKK